MPVITINRTVEHPWPVLFTLVLDIERYPRFVPHCTRVRILSRREPTPEQTEIRSRMTVGLLPLQIAYSNRTLADRAARRISVDSTDGPMRHLHVLWRFEPRGEGRTEIGLIASYEFRSMVIATLAAGIFERLLGQIIDAFERQANTTKHGPEALAGRR